jgi:cysteine desulfurase
MEAYFDNSATTAPCIEAIRAVNEALTDCWGNPSSLHRTGNKAKELLDLSRESIAKRLSCDPSEIFFTSGGTESNNLAVMGLSDAPLRQADSLDERGASEYRRNFE